MKKKVHNNRLINLFIVASFFCFALLIVRLSFLTLSNEIDGVSIKDFAKSRNTVSKTIHAKRGNIYDKNGEPLAINVSSYTLIAYLDPKRSEGEKKLYHVKDINSTAASLATVIDLPEDEIKSILSQKDLYQVEFGLAGKGLTELQKEKIEKLNLTGIAFIEDEKRYYPNGNFASYTLGYAKNNEEGKIEGEMGIEELLDEVLAGTDGYTSYQTDPNGYKISGTKEVGKKAINGNDVYLTLDSNIQFFVEQAAKDAELATDFEWLILIIADAKTGAILGITQSPSFDPNIKDIDNWINQTVTAYEPGSIMKTYTYMAAMENGTYDGSRTYPSGRYTTEDGTVIVDWNKYGWGDITYDQGYMASSNVGVINIMNNFINKTVLYDYFMKMGFGKKTGITLANEEKGKIGFTYQTEIYNASFGQGITTTPMQHIQALTSIANDGVMLSPYIIDKVKDQDGKVVFKGKREEVATVASHETVEKMKDLMYYTVHNDWDAATATMYDVPGYELIGKTGTAQLINPYTGEYYTTDNFSTKSFVGMWPKNDPEVIIYASVNKPQYGMSTALKVSVRELVENVSKYLNIFDETSSNTIENFKVDNYINKNKDKVIQELSANNIKYIVLGSGNKIINQYPSKNEVISTNDLVILMTNSDTYEFPNITGYSKKQVRAICDMLGYTYIFQGYGYASDYKIEDKKITINFIK